MEIYDEIRPPYPAALYDALFDMLPPAPSILEVGPGTGQATKDLLARGASVHAVEIGPATAAKLRSNLSSDQLTVTVADFEQATITPASFDAVFSATAYHWISPQAQADRPAEMLKPGGLICVVDLIQVTSPTNDFFAAAQPIYDKYGQTHQGPPPPTRNRADPSVRTLFERDDRFVDVTVRSWDWDQVYSAARYRKLMLSYSGTQMMPAEDRIGLLDEVERSSTGGSMARSLGHSSPRSRPHVAAERRAARCRAPRTLRRLRVDVTPQSGCDAGGSVVEIRVILCADTRHIDSHGGPVRTAARNAAPSAEVACRRPLLSVAMSSIPPSASAHPATWKFGYPIYHAESREQWRAWLEANHDAAPGVWLCSWRSVTGRPTCPYPEVVEEAICFGWIDSTAYRLDDDRGLQLLTPRKPKSTWTRLNRQRVADMEAAGLMTDAGRRAVEVARGNGWWTILDPVEDLVEPDDLSTALDANPMARLAWDTFPPSARKAMLWWVIGAAKQDTRARRIEAVVAKAVKGERAQG